MDFVSVSTLLTTSPIPACSFSIIDNQPNSQQQEGVPRGRDPFYVAKKGAVERVRESLHSRCGGHDGLCVISRVTDSPLSRRLALERHAGVLPQGSNVEPSSLYGSPRLDTQPGEVRSEADVPSRGPFQRDS